MGKGILRNNTTCENCSAEVNMRFCPSCGQENTETKKSFPVYVSRSNDDFKTPQYKGMKIINEITKITDSQPGIYHKIIVPDLKNTFGVKDFEVKYNKNSDTYNVSYTDNDGTYVDEQPMTSPIFQEYILNTQLHN